MADNRTHTTTNLACPKALEFFAGIGLARLGLEEAGFQVEWSNDIDAAKCEMYRNHFGNSPEHKLIEGDMSNLHGEDLPRDASLAWGSSPCTDLSLAGTRTGLNGKQSGAFWQYARLLRELGSDRPPIAVLENVNGLATSHSGEDLAAAVRAFNELGYSVDVLSIDTRRFIPQSRPRLFLIGLQDPPAIEQFNSPLRPDWMQQVFADSSLRTHRAPLPEPPSPLMSGLSMYIENMPDNDGRWWDAEKTDKFLDTLSPVQFSRIESLRKSTNESYRTAYRRTRNGKAVWEVRADDVSGCLRTARGGSSRQAVIRLGNGKASVRWMTPREYATLMGAAHYNIDGLRPNQVMFGFGDAVSVPVVEWLGKHYFMPALHGSLGKDLYTEQTLLASAS
ncbi:DNA cytosine methyltransferase [Bifidobacterium oedipodis]|uniref:DNA (cytosine-5-)-methyltransferase n=1 Tax=Bifidobacterium oedipodis TaxID=2675322 RepID=A0A7Y0HT47_9BIFI|nr:DNA cytosine methyltransferase [Bifidobacterium sp. DSM 109957]NMM94696.1 restriction endonuclease subunit M [Bifidobacterium sp. DSM 109957]